MIQRELLVHVTPTPREIEREIWNMDSTGQVELLLAMSQRYKNECGNVCMQLQAVSDDLMGLLNDEEKANVRQLIRQLLDYFGGEG